MVIIIVVVMVVMVIRTDRTTRTHGTNKTDRITRTHGTHKTDRITRTRDRQDRQVRDERQDRQIWHLNLTFRVTSVGQLLQFLLCFYAFVQSRITSTTLTQFLIFVSASINVCYLSNISLYDLFCSYLYTLVFVHIINYTLSFLGIITTGKKLLSFSIHPIHIS